VTTRRVKNFAKGTVSGTYGAGDTSITLATGHGSRFLDPATDGPFAVVWWNATDFADPADDPNREIVLCTERSGDVLTFVRGQEDTAASTKNAAGTYKVIAPITAVAWNSDETLSQTFRGLSLRTHPDADLAHKQTVFSADVIVMHDGEAVENWSDVVTDITVSGAGGLDTGSEAVSTFYKQYAIYNGTDKKGCFHRDRDWFLDLDITAGEDASQGIRSAVDNSTVKVSQGITPVTAGKLVMIDVKVVRTGSPTGKIWWTLESNSGGVPSGTALATSWKFDVSRIPTTAVEMRVPFWVPYSVSASTLYHVVAQGDYTVSGSNYISWRMDGSAASYAGGSKALWDSDSTTWTPDTDDDLWLRVYIERNNVDFSTTVPAGYSYAHIGYAYNDSAGNLTPFVQHDRRWHHRIMSNALVVNETSSSPTLVDLAAYIPPSSIIDIVLGLTNTGAAVARANVGDITCIDVTSASVTGNMIPLGTDTVSGEFMTSLSPPVPIVYQAIMIDATAGADLYLPGFAW